MIAGVPPGLVVGALCGLLLPLPTIVRTARGERRPERAASFLWTTQAGVAVAAGAAAGADPAALVVPACAAVVLGATLLATFVPPLRGQQVPADAPGWGPWADRLCLTLCGLAPLAWGVTGDPLVALVLATLTQAVAALPALGHAWRGEEAGLPHLGFAINAGCALGVLGDRSPAGWAFPAGQLVVCGLLALVALVRSAPLRGAHGLPVGNRAWTLVAGVGALGVGAAVVVGVLPRPAAAPPPQAALVAHPVVLPAAVPAVPIPSVRARVTVPPSPGDIAMAPDGRYALIAHRTRMAVSVLDTRLGQVTATIPTPQAPPRFVTFCRGRAYLSMFDDPADGPAGGPDRRLIGVLDTTANEVVATIPVGSRPYAAACSPDGAQLWVPGQDDGRVDVLDTATNRLLRSVPVPVPDRLVFSADGRTVYASCPDADAVVVLDAATSSVVRTIPVGTAPHGGALSPDGRSLAVVDRGSAEVSIVDTAHAVEVRRVPTGENPQDVAWSADGRLVYTTNVDGLVNGRPVGTVSVIDVVTGGQSRLVTDGPGIDSAPTGIARSADGSTGYVTNRASGTVTVYALGE